MAGIGAARVQMVRMQAELAAARQSQARAAAAALGNSADAATGPGPGPAEADEERGRCRALQLQARSLRHELAKWRHQADVLSSERPNREAEIASMKEELSRTCDVLESTRSAARHAEVDTTPPLLWPSKARSLTSLEQRQEPEAAATALPLSGAAQTCIEALCERTVREKVEKKNEMMAAKARRLMAILAAQHLLVQRLEKQLLKEEGGLDHRGAQLAHQAQRHRQLKGLLRRRSDDAVAAALGMPRSSSMPRPRARSTSGPPGPALGEGHSKAGLVTILPPIDA